ncbi:polysaccharide deacetylase family protein [Indioceanicola profundi]|uniref:polysaccharide deacetylase family protein n=1 Tax=Indioceanicola profundi TaxID=2220096 RepID=UPI000E6AD441|nr:polysaccharide deacetylase family protein [Indioceanicola profundi]
MSAEESGLLTRAAPLMEPMPAGHRETRAGRLYRQLWRLGLFDRLIRAQPDRLTVLLYHRIADPEAVARNGFAENVSATPERFDEQVRYLKTHFNLITASHLADAMAGRAELPPRAALITFDDGYRDNHDIAMPILRRHGAPALLCVAAGCVGSNRPFFWDLAGYCFAHSTRSVADLPILGERSLGGTDRERALHDWVHAAKRLPESDKRAALARLPDALGVAVPPDAFADSHVTWSQIARMQEYGFEIGAHTITHPILSQVPPDRARNEIRRSRTILERRLGSPVRGFAYPNGSARDFGDEHERMVAEAGFEMAFTTVEGPAWRKEAFRSRFRIRRINVAQSDTLARFAAKVSGMAQLPIRLRAILTGAKGLAG